MSVTHTTAARNAATDAVTALIGASGNLKFRLAGTVGAPGTAVATLPLSATAFGASATGTATQAEPVDFMAVAKRYEKKVQQEEHELLLLAMVL